jgi:hypothetical protein
MPWEEQILNCQGQGGASLVLVRKTPFLEPFKCRNDQFTKTGSEQTDKTRFRQASSAQDNAWRARMWNRDDGNYILPSTGEKQPTR